MRVLSALLLCGFLFAVSAVISQAPPSRAMQPAQTPPSAESRAFCPQDEEDLGEARALFDPVNEEVSVVDAFDVEQPEVVELLEHGHGLGPPAAAHVDALHAGDEARQRAGQEQEPQVFATIDEAA